MSDNRVNSPEQSLFTPCWDPFDVAPRGAPPIAPRPILMPGGIGDRLRAAAFAEIQAREAFLWAARRFEDAPPALFTAWTGLALAEDRHLGWLVARAKELGIDLRERQVSDHLWVSLVTTTSAEQFSVFMASAEERGRKAGERFKEQLRATDPESARIFGQIALEEIAHIDLCRQFFPNAEISADGRRAPQRTQSNPTL